MFGEKAESSFRDGRATGAQTLIEQDASFEGKLTFSGTVEIKGEFKGEVFSEGTLIIGEGAKVSAQIEVNKVVIRGHVEGHIDAKSLIEIHPPAVVRGEICSPGLVISEGAFFEGQCSMGKQGQEAPVLELKSAGEEGINF
ncbi:MAG: polymer-forming cytoskeletal protein [Deltaproteobacteria bacterium]|nr:polymer-forming cytoskeletal protein [Deltaproteobacteria bacterium]